MISRRQFIKYLSYSFIVTKLNPVLADNKKIIKYNIIAKKETLSFYKNFKANLILYTNLNPGPQLNANVGDILKIEFTNNLDEPTSIHWHGIKNINKMDGVPYLTQDLIQPGETFLYEFPVNN